ncbi:transporter [Luteitalea sp. TBR-22]|uniref:TolC family protein n=1 Tax=Luteitalea sp. TBR-22 TaxID=2802971 RepID=UPI001AF345F6|nr:TolC family protein [Luteitalea sp. TBR-22]BCS31806.1 transporter [Luteitalea sp. TBR-22]
MIPARAWAGWLLVAACVTPAAAQPGGTGEILSIEVAVSRALEANRGLQIARSEVEGLSDRIAAVRTRKYPVLSARLLEGAFLLPLEATFPAGAFGSFGAIGPFPPTDTTVRSDTRFLSAAVLTAAQPLTQLRKVSRGIRGLQLEQDLARERIDAQSREVASGVRKAYYQLQRTQAGLQATEETVALARELVRLATAHRDARVVLGADLLTAQSRLARAEHEARRLEDAAVTLREQLNALMGRDLALGFDVPPLPAPGATEASLPEAEARALEARSEIRQAELRRQQAENAVHLAREAYIPDISVAVTYAALANVEVLPRQTFTAGVLLEWEPWTWGRVGHEVAASRRAVDRAALAATEAGEGIRREVRAAWRTLGEARRFIDVTALAQQAAREQVRVANERVRAEASLVREALQAQAALAEADAQHDAALTSFWTAFAEFERVTGVR